jgi:orotidine-5'-phosphate decarboxylase
MTILGKFEARVQVANTLLCVGLDPEMERLPVRFQKADNPFFEFSKWTIEQTHPFTAAYKPNVAFFEARGLEGIHELDLTMEYLRTQHPGIVTICDAKRGDIGNTNRGYVFSIFDQMGFDAVTLHPYLGKESLQPFLERNDKACIILCRTSNSGAGELQDLLVDGKPLWERVAERVANDWNTNGNCMIVVGATYPEEMRSIRAVAPELTFLVPGIGAQGGDIAAVVAAGLDAKGRGLMISSSRGILYSDDPAAAACEVRDEIRSAVTKTLEAREVAHASS